MKTQPITVKTEIPLVKEIFSLKKPTIEKIREQYGQIGVDIFQGKENITVFDKKYKPKTFIGRIYQSIKDFFSYRMPDFQSDDTLKIALIRFLSGKDIYKPKEIYEKFGEKGLREFRGLQVLGYIRQVD